MGDWKNSVGPLVVIKKNLSPFDTPTSLDVDWNSSITQEGKWAMGFFFPQNDSASYTPFDCHSMMGVCWMAIEFFWSPKRGGACNIIFGKEIIPTMPTWVTKFFSITIRWVGRVGWRRKKFSCPPYGDHGNQKFLVSIEVWLVASFSKALIEAITQWGCVEWWSKKIVRHLTYPHH